MTSGQLVEKIYGHLPERNRINRNRDSIHILLDGQKLTMEVRPNQDNCPNIKYCVTPQGEPTAWLNTNRQYHGEIDSLNADFKVIVDDLLENLREFMGKKVSHSRQN